MAPVFESRGRFWFLEQYSPEDPVVPEASMPGNLTIREDGSARLALDGCLTDGLSIAIEHFNTGKEIPGLILGFIYKEAEYVLLSELGIARSHISFAGANREELSASFCVRGCRPPIGSNSSPVIQEFEINLSALEEWIRPYPIRAASSIADGSKISQTFEYWHERFDFPCGTKDIVFQIGIDRDFSKLSVFGTGRVELSNRAVLTYKSAEPMELGDVRSTVVHLQEFFALLTGIYIELDWPRIIERKGEDVVRQGVFYFRRSISASNEASVADLWTFFRSVSGSIGPLFEKFTRRREELGPGLYLYFACMRTRTMFPENRFTTLTMGLESLYRRDPELPQVSMKDQQRIDRILQAIESESDRKWLEKKLARRAELGLDDKLRRLFHPLENIIKKASIADFAEQCVRLRNDITHFGGLRGNSTYSELMQRLRTLTPALSDLYHALLLIRMGYSQEAVMAALESSPASHKINAHLKLARLEKVGQNNYISYSPDPT